MFRHIWRAFINDASLYNEVKADVSSSEAWGVILTGLAAGAVLSALDTGFANGASTFIAGIVGYLLMVSWAWLIGAVIGKGSGTWGDVQKAVAYPYFIPSILLNIPIASLAGIIGFVMGIWLLVTLSTAIRETLRIGKGLTFFIVISAVFILFGILVVGPAMMAVLLGVTAS